MTVGKVLLCRKPSRTEYPAKFSRGLIQRIIGHAIANGWIGPGSLVVDPFGGIGCGGIAAAYCDIRWIGVELEQKFVDLARQNFELHRRKWEKLGCPQPVMIQGDSRELCRILSKPGSVDAVVSSPPFTNCFQTQDIEFNRKKAIDAGRNPDGYGCIGGSGNYGQTPGNLGNLKPGSVDALLSSPPFAENPGSKEQLGGSVVSGMVRQNPRHPGEKLYFTDYAKQNSPGNIANLPPGDVSLILSSPPFQSSIATKEKDGTLAAQGLKADGTRRGGSLVTGDYGNSDGQLGNSQGETFWSAAKIILEQCHQILKPGGYAIWVVKAFVRKGKIVDFPGDWRRLCESLGFVTVCEHHAMLIKESEYESLFGIKVKNRKERKSFFRKLCESKGGPRIDFENVICMRKT